MLAVIQIGGASRRQLRLSWVARDAAKGERIMTEASGGIKRAEVERTLVQKSLEDEDFRQRLLDDPKAAVEQELGRGLPESTEVRVVEESADTIYLVLPSASRLGQGEDLSDQELEAVAGGAWTGLDCITSTVCGGC
jgi:Nitrile hydratase, alpha chain